MEEVIINKNEEIVMKLLHFFITEQGYSPIVLHGAKDEIWLENMSLDYKIVRIVTNYIHNNEQLDFDIFKTKKIVSRIKKKTFTLQANTLSIFLNLGDSVQFDNYIHLNNIDCAKIKEIKDLKKYDFVIDTFPNITKKTSFKEKGMSLFVKLTEEISKKSQKEQEKAEDIFAPKKPIVTYVLMAINIFIFLLMYILGDGSEDSATLINFGANVSILIKMGDYYRLITSAFLHIGIIHLCFNMYALYILGSQIESFFGKTKYVIIYLVSAVLGNLLSMLFITDSISAGASGALFGLFGALIYFGYHYRIYLGNALRTQIIPVIAINLLLGFTLSGINVIAHIGGLVGGILITMALGVKYKSTKQEKINGIVLLIMFTVFLTYLAFK
ncbi:MAG: rhomboid family intramembrane serine protease [Bacilli bacterium]|nr:rhomboid family intramembrane serine protease [Bacilli bacterium]